MKRIGLMLAAVGVALAAGGRTLVVDETGSPMIGALILDSSSTPVGIVDKEGVLPEIAPERYPLTLRSLGFDDIAVAAPAPRIVMKEMSCQLGEVTVTPDGHPACHVVCYVRETSGMKNDSDTLRVTAQYMVDFMLKDSPKAKGFPTWDSPRVLNREVECSRSPAGEVDKSELDALSWYGYFRLSGDNITLPEELHGLTAGSHTEKSDKLGNDMAIFQLTPTRFTVFTDALADREGHTWSPGLAKLLGATMDFHEFWTRSTHSYSPDEIYNIGNTIAKTFSIKITGRGRLFRSLFGSKVPVDMTCYCEIYPVAIEYLTAQEAKELKKEKEPFYPMTVPANARPDQP